MAIDAHMRATFVRLGWSGYGDYRMWWPAHLQQVLDENMIGEAWLLARLPAHHAPYTLRVRLTTPPQLTALEPLARADCAPNGVVPLPFICC